MNDIVDPDRALVIKAQQGDKSAYSLLVIKYQNVVAKVLFGYLRDKQEVEDGIQEVFMKVWKTIHTFQGRSKFFTWLYRITINVGLSIKDKNQRRNTNKVDEEKTTSFADFSFDPVADNESARLKVAVHDAIENLPDSIKECIKLREMEFLDYQTIADIQEIPVGTVRSRLSRGRQMLADLLRDWK